MTILRKKCRSSNSLLHLKSSLVQGPIDFQNLTVVLLFLLKVIVKCDHLKSIQLNIPPKKKATWLTTLPNLENIFIYQALSVGTFSKYHMVMTMLAGEMKQLKKVYVRNNSRKFDQFGLGDFDAARRGLTGAEKLKIYFKSDETDKTGRLNGTVCDFDKIEALRVETESFTNPLVTEYLTIKGVGRHFYNRGVRRFRRPFYFY